MSNGQGRAPPANRKTPPKGSTPAHTNDKATNKPSAKANFICIFPRRNFKTTQKVRRQKTLEYQLFIRFIARNRSRTEQRNRNRPGLIPESITIPKAARSNFKHGIIAVSGAFWMRNGPSPFRRKGARKGANYKRDHRQRISDRRIRSVSQPHM